MRWTFEISEVRPGMGFLALKGETADGRALIPAALAAGAADVIDGPHARQEKIEHVYAKLEGYEAFVKRYPFLGGKGGSIGLAALEEKLGGYAFASLDGRGFRVGERLTRMKEIC